MAGKTRKRHSATLLPQVLWAVGPGGTSPTAEPDMASNALDKALSRESLSQAWKFLYSSSSKASKNTVGVDGICINDFEVSAKGNLNFLSRSIRNRTFRFNSLNPFIIPKPNGKFRLIAVPTVQDRIVQRALVNHLSITCAHHIINGVSFGFIKDRSVKDAAEIACKIRKTKPWIFKTDITAFFDSIDRQRLRETIKRIVKEKSLHAILYDALNCEVESSQSSVNKKIRELGIQRGTGIRQGMPLSPLFSNLLLSSFDQLVEQRGFHALRYADDIIFLGKSEIDCHQAFEFCKEEFAKLDLKIPEIEPNSKSVIYSPSDPAEFLGLELMLSGSKYELRMSDKQILKVKEEILRLGSIPELLTRKITLKNFNQVMTSKRTGYLAAYDVCTNIGSVANELASLEQKALRKIYADGLGIDLGKIDKEARTFLGLT